jgi:hypothetical protein
MQINVFLSVWTGNEISCKSCVTCLLSARIRECQLTQVVPVRHLDLWISDSRTSLCLVRIRTEAKRDRETGVHN